MYNVLKAREKPHLQQVICNIKHIYYAERYKAGIKGKPTLFVKKWSTMFEYFKTHEGTAQQLVSIHHTVE